MYAHVYIILSGRILLLYMHHWIALFWRIFAIEKILTLFCSVCVRIYVCMYVYACVCMYMHVYDLLWAYPIPDTHLWMALFWRIFAMERCYWCLLEALLEAH